MYNNAQARTRTSISREQLNTSVHFSRHSSSSCPFSRAALYCSLLREVPLGVPFAPSRTPRLCDGDAHQGVSTEGGRASKRELDGHRRLAAHTMRSPWFSDDVTRKKCPWIYDKGSRLAHLTWTSELSFGMKLFYGEGPQTQTLYNVSCPSLPQNPRAQGTSSGPWHQNRPMKLSDIHVRRSVETQGCRQ